MVSTAVKTATVNAHSGGSASLTLPVAGGEEGAFRRVNLLLLPSHNSRHNSALRPDVVASLCRRYLSVEEAAGAGRDGVAVVALLPAHTAADSADERSAVLNFTSAVARTLPTYTRKGDRHETPGHTAVDLVFVRHDDGSVVENAETLAFAGHAAEGVRQAAALVDMPTNELNTTTLSERAFALTKDLPHVKASEIVGEDLRLRGFGGIYGVGKASTHPPRLVILDYRPPGASKTVVWAGKGIVYDTGGLSIKDRLNMVGGTTDFSDPNELDGLLMFFNFLNLPCLSSPA